MLVFDFQIAKFSAIHTSMAMKLPYGKTNPDRTFTAGMSPALTTPERFTSYLKFVGPVFCVMRAFNAAISLAFTEPLLSTSPTRNPSDTCFLLLQVRDHHYIASQAMLRVRYCITS